MANAPFCNVTVKKIQGNPGAAVKRNNQAGGGATAIPANSSLPQAIRIINNNFNTLIQQFGRPFPSPSEPNSGTSGLKDVTKPTWGEVRSARQTKKVRVENPEDPDQFVDIEQIEGLTMKNAKTGETWKWTR